MITGQNTGTGSLEEIAKGSRKGAQVLIDILNEYGVDIVFGHTGGAVIPAHAEINRRLEIGKKAPKFILCGQEGGAGHAAEGYAAASGKTAVVLVTSGPGATNLVTAIADAYADSRPVVFITGQVTNKLLGKDAFQEVDITGVTTPITKHNCLIRNADELGYNLRQAFYIASTGRKGPVVVDICKNAFEEKTKKGDEIRHLPGYSPSVKMDKKGAKMVLEELLSHKRPVILAGGGVISSGSGSELYSFAQKYSLPVSLTFMAMGAIPSSSGLFLGMAGMHGTAAANYALNDADFILGIGARLDDRVAVQDFGKGKKIARVDLDPSELTKSHAFISLQADAKDFLSYALGYSAAHNVDLSGWLSTISNWKREAPVQKLGSFGGLNPEHVVKKISQLADENAILTTGVGQHQMWAAQHYDFKYPGQWISSGGLGTMGFGLPAAIGAYYAQPSRQIICIDGDGSFQMNIQELATLNRNMNIKVFIFNNGCLGMVRQWENRFYGGYNNETCLARSIDCDDMCRNGDGCYTFNPDFLALSHVYKQVNTLRVTSEEDLTKRILTALRSPGPYVVDVLIDRKADVLPMVPPGKGFADLLMK